MDINAIVTLVGSLGFPIVCCGALFYQQNKTMKEFSDKMERTIDKLSDNIIDGTEATNKLITTVEILYRIGGDVNG